MPDELTVAETTPRGIEPTEEPLVTSDFIRTYVRYADVIEAPPEAHEAIAIQLLATALNPRVDIQNGAIRVPLDLWLLLLSESGFGRNTLVELARPILDAADISGLLLNATWGSKQAFYQNISQNPRGLFVWPELAIVLRNLADGRFSGVKEWITDRYDNWRVPEAILYRETGNRSDTPPIVFQHAPRLNILATSSVDWFISNLGQDDTTGGFVPRWILERIQGSNRLIPIPQRPNEALVAPLAEHLRQVSTLTGTADLSCVEEIFRAWYEAAHRRFAEQPNSALAVPFFNRLRTHVLKLSVLYEVSQSLSLHVTPSAMERAIAAAAASEATIFALLPTGMSREGSEVDRVAARIRQAASDGILRSEFTRAFQYVRTNDRESRLRTLIDGGVVVRFWRSTSGRSAEVLVHRDYANDYAAGFPDDQRWE